MMPLSHSIKRSETQNSSKSHTCSYSEKKNKQTTPSASESMQQKNNTHSQATNSAHNSWKNTQLDPWGNHQTKHKNNKRAEHTYNITKKPLDFQSEMYTYYLSLFIVFVMNCTSMITLTTKKCHFWRTKKGFFGC